MAKNSDLKKMATEMAGEMLKKYDEARRQKALRKKQEDAVCMRIGRTSLKIIRKSGVEGDPVELVVLALTEKYGENGNA